MKTSYALLTLTALSTSAFANMEQGRFDQQGFGGELTFLTGYGKSESNLSTENSTKTGVLNTSGQSDSQFIAAPFGQLRYTFGDQQVFFGMSRDDIVEGVFAMELGYAFELQDHSALSLSYLPTIAAGEVWEDPYLVNTARKETDVSGNAYRIQYENIANLGIDADFAFYDRDVDNERSGSQSSVNTALLNRDGSGYLVGISSGVPLTRSIFLMPTLRYHHFDADGKAMAYDKYSLDLTAMYMFGNSAISLNGGYSKADYDAENPLFNTTREDTGYEINLAYEYRDFLGWQNFGFNILAGYSNTDSNITFYDQNNYMMGVGISYLF
ncbi:DUF2860 domain-containing protein [Vibrio coralliilyticus]|uniref:DUF2860 domain-containing protein n=1 Tax=Vibrio coralliilyticus TaxID=190893 RepID=UPI002FD09CDB